MKLKTLEQFESKDPCECGGNCGCGGKPVNEKFNFSKKEVEKAANLIASAISQADMVKAKVHDLEYDKGRGAGFEISIDGEKYEGGSYVVKDNGDVVNAAIGNSHPNAVYNTIGNKDIADVFINMEKYESNTVTESKEMSKKEVRDLKVKINNARTIGKYFTKDEVEFLQSLFESEVNEAVSKATKIYQIATPAPQSMLVEELENLFGDDYRNIVTEFKEDEGYESVLMFNLSKSDIKKIEDNIADVLIWEYSIKKGKEITESEVNEAKKYKFKELAKAWEFVYGEEMEDEYEGFYQEVVGKYKNKVTKEDIAEIWNNVYGEDIAVEYDGFFKSIKENLNEAINLERFNNIEEANADGTISDDEDDDVENMLADVEYMVDELVNYIKVETEKIGGRFRSPGMEAQCLKLVKETFKKHKVRL